VFSDELYGYLPRCYLNRGKSQNQVGYYIRLPYYGYNLPPLLLSCFLCLLAARAGQICYHVFTYRYVRTKLVWVCPYVRTKHSALSQEKNQKKKLFKSPRNSLLLYFFFPCRLPAPPLHTIVIYSKYTATNAHTTT